MLELVKSDLVVPIDPMQVLERSWEIGRPFLAFTKDEVFQARKKAKLFKEGGFIGARIHEDKFAYEIFYELGQMDLAKKGGGNWWIVEKSAAGYLMRYMATVLGSKIGAQATTDSLDALLIPAENGAGEQNEKREIILKELIPFPEDIDFSRLRKFKDKHHTLLHTFKNKIERIVLDPSISEGTPMFDNQIEELKIRKDELAAKMGESQFKNIFWGSVCGVVGAVTGLAAVRTVGGLVGGLPGFANAVHSALKIEKAENTFDQSGMKYLALLEKRLGLSH